MTDEEDQIERRKELRKDVDLIFATQCDQCEMLDEVKTTVKEIKDNHLTHLNMKVDKSLFRSGVTLGGLAFIGIMIAILGVMITLGSI